MRGTMPEKIPLTKEERRLRRAARREKQRQANIGRARKMHLARVESEKSGNSQPLAIQGENPPALHRLLRLVLLALARRILSCGPADKPLVHALCGALQDRRTECAVLFMADCCHRRILDTAGRKTPVRLYREGVRADHAHQAICRDQDIGAGLRPDSRSAWPPHGVFSVSASAEFPLHAGAPETDFDQLDHGGATSWSSGTRAGGTRRSIRPSGRQEQSFALAAARAAG